MPGCHPGLSLQTEAVHATAQTNSHGSEPDTESGASTVHRHRNKNWLLGNEANKEEPRGSRLGAVLPPAVQADEAVSQAGHKVLVVVSRPEDEVPVDRENPQRVQQGHLLSYRLVRATELVKHSAVQTVVDGVEGKTLGASLRLEETKAKSDVYGAVLRFWMKPCHLCGKTERAGPD